MLCQGIYGTAWGCLFWQFQHTSFVVLSGFHALVLKGSHRSQNKLKKTNAPKPRRIQEWGICRPPSTRTAIPCPLYADFWGQHCVSTGCNKASCWEHKLIGHPGCYQSLGEISLEVWATFRYFSLCLFMANLGILTTWRPEGLINAGCSWLPGETVLWLCSFSY